MPAPNDGPELVAALDVVNAARVKTGRYPLSPEIVKTLTSFWTSGRRRLVVRKGRQSGWSTALAIVAVLTAQYGRHRFQAGTRLAFIFVSVKIDECRERLINIIDTLEMLGISYTRRADEIELDDRPVRFVVLPCSTRSVGHTSGALFEDEVSLWWSDEKAANPGEEVDAILTPGLVTQPNARIYTISSPRTRDDFHAQLMAIGDNDTQMTVQGPSWHWNPTIDEATTRALMPNERRWRREYLAEPASSALSPAFSPEEVDAAFRPRPRIQRTGALVLVIDPSKLRNDAFTWCFACWAIVPADPAEEFLYLEAHDPERNRSIRRMIRDDLGHLVRNPEWQPDSEPILCFTSIRAVDPERTPTAEAIVAELSAEAKARGVRTVVSDAFESFALSSMFQSRALAYKAFDWSAPAKERALVHLQRLFREGRVFIEGDETGRMRRDLLEVEERLSSGGGGVTFESRRTKYGHGDAFSLVANCSLFDLSGEFRGSPVQTRRGGVRVRQQRIGNL